MRHNPAACRDLARTCRSVLLLCVLGLAGCGERLVTVIDPAGFEAMVLRAAPVLQQGGVVAADGTYLESLLPFFDDRPEDAGERLLQRLSPSFRYRDTAPSMLPATFAQSVGQGDTVQVHPSGFRLIQGRERIEVSLLGLAGWEGRGKTWFVQCRIASGPDEERTYYLVLPRPEDDVYRPEVLAVHDCRYGRCTTYLEGGLGQGEAPPENAVIELEPGLQDITAPPAD